MDSKRLKRHIRFLQMSKTKLQCLGRDPFVTLRHELDFWTCMGIYKGIIAKKSLGYAFLLCRHLYLYFISW